MTTENKAVGDALPANCEVIEVRVADLGRLFKAIDPSPFHEKDLDADAEEFIVSWAKEVRRDVPFALVVHLQGTATVPGEEDILRDAVRRFFTRRADGSRRRLRELFRVGRTSLFIGLAFLASLTAIGDLLARRPDGGGLVSILRQSILIGGWVAMWRPLEVFLYDWWPIRAEARLYDRLGAMPVRIVRSP